MTSDGCFVLADLGSASHQLLGLELLLALEVLGQLEVFGHDGELARGQAGVILDQEAGAGGDQHAADGPGKKLTGGSTAQLFQRPSIAIYLSISQFLSLLILFPVTSWHTHRGYF